MGRNIWIEMEDKKVYISLSLFLLTTNWYAGIMNRLNSHLNISDIRDMMACQYMKCYLYCVSVVQSISVDLDGQWYSV